MKFYCRYRYNFGGVIALTALIYLIANRLDIAMINKLLLINFSAPLVHRFEENAFPVG